MEDNNNLENFFRQKFNQKIEHQDWNIPDNYVWDNIASQIPLEKKKRIIGLVPLLLFGTILLFTSLFLGYDNHVKTKEIGVLKKDLKECAEHTVENRESAMKKSNESHNVQVEMPSNIKETKIQLTQMQPDVSVKTADMRSSKSIVTKGRNQQALPANEASEITINSMVKDEINFDDKALEQKQLFTHIKSPEKLAENQFNHLTSINKKIKPTISLNASVIIPTPKSNHPFFIGPKVSYIFWQDRIRGSFDNPLSELLINEETTPSISYGLSLSKVLNKHMVFNTGINYYERDQKSKYAINLPYSTVDEIAVGSEFENRFQHSLPTGLGSINTNLVLVRSASSVVQNNENVYLDFALSNHMKAISIPLTLSYFVKEAGSGLFLQGGLTHEYIIQNKIKEVDTRSNHQFVKDKSITVDYNNSQINRLNTSVMTGIGYQKSLNSNLDFTISAQYGFALNNTYQSNAYQHKINQLNAQIMLLKVW